MSKRVPFCVSVFHTETNVLCARKEGNDLGVDLQKAGIWKRMAAWLLDIILLATLAVAVAYLLSMVFGFDTASAKLDEQYAKYESQYGVTFDITQEAYEAMTAEEKAAYDRAYEALIADDEVLYTYNLVINLTLLITSLGLLAATMLLEFAVPLLLKNGQTVGKKCFGLGLIRQDGVKMNTLQLFTRTLLGKYTIGTMIPVYVFMLMFWGDLGALGTVILGGLAIGQILCMGISQNNSAIHDLLAGTVVVDIASQQIFSSTEELLAYTKRIHAERAQRQEY